MVFAISVFVADLLVSWSFQCQIFCVSHPSPDRVPIWWPLWSSEPSHFGSKHTILHREDNPPKIRWPRMGEASQDGPPKIWSLILWSTSHGRYIRPCFEDIMSYNSAISACEKAMEWRVALQLLEDTCGTVDGSEILLPSHPMACSTL